MKFAMLIFSLFAFIGFVGCVYGQDKNNNDKTDKNDVRVLYEAAPDNVPWLTVQDDELAYIPTPAYCYRPTGIVFFCITGELRLAVPVSLSPIPDRIDHINHTPEISDQISYVFANSPVYVYPPFYNIITALSIDVPAIIEHHREKNGTASCHIGCATVVYDKVCTIGTLVCEDNFLEWDTYTCADRRRVMLVGEDGVKHCLLLQGLM